MTDGFRQGVAQHEVLVAAAEERGWLGYRQALNEAPSVVPLAQEWYGAPQKHLWEEWEQGTIERGDEIDSDRAAAVSEAERDAYVQQLTECQEEAYDIDILDLEQRRLLEQVHHGPDRSQDHRLSRPGRTGPGSAAPAVGLP